MADYPGAIYEERVTENLPGIVYDPTDKKNLYSEDFQHHADEIIAIEETLGVNPEGAEASVVERLNLADKKVLIQPSPKISAIPGIMKTSIFDLAVADNEIYTCPAGKKAYWASGLITTYSAGGTTNGYYKIKRAGTAYQFTPSVAYSVNTFVNAENARPIILEAGDILIFTSDRAGGRLYSNIAEFDSNIPLKTEWIFNPDGNEQIVYTCPAGKSAFLTLMAFVYYMNTSGGALTITDWIVPSGESTGNSTKIAVSSSVANGAASQIASRPHLKAGDSYVIKTSASGNGAVYVTYLEQDV